MLYILVCVIYIIIFVIMPNNSKLAVLNEVSLNMIHYKYLEYSI